ncbi:hypothetical protein RHSIM_Rhsim01G0290200 [Rhododendron simsii]|uniref:RING-CH-type domain-containing protein n=1 Tax=Rhododendron simsii TaxID=118357 RepID=A0A834HH84_RHOSS|nr:hypothetical protein RHSIM_Rhsim01G0290200 [Rhododendron simsii]
MGEVVLFMEELKPSSAIVASCRICHGDEEEEEEESQESCKSLEVPCACSGTLMAICVGRLQKFEPGYTTPPSKSQLIDAIVTIRLLLAGLLLMHAFEKLRTNINGNRGSLEVLRREQELQHPGILVPTVEAEGRMLETNNSSEGSSAPDWSAIWCRSMVLVVSSLLLSAFSLNH